MWRTEGDPFVGYRCVAAICNQRLCYSLVLIQEIRYSRSVIRTVRHDPSRFTRVDPVVSEVLFYTGVRNYADDVVTINDIFVVYFYSHLPYWTVSYVNCSKRVFLRRMCLYLEFHQGGSDLVSFRSFLPPLA